MPRTTITIHTTSDGARDLLTRIADMTDTGHPLTIEIQHRPGPAPDWADTARIGAEPQGPMLAVEDCDHRADSVDDPPRCRACGVLVYRGARDGDGALIPINLADALIELNAWAEPEPLDKQQPFNHRMCGNRHTVQEGCAFPDDDGDDAVVRAGIAMAVADPCGCPPGEICTRCAHTKLGADAPDVARDL